MEKPLCCEGLAQKLAQVFEGSCLVHGQRCFTGSRGGASCVESGYTQRSSFRTLSRRDAIPSFGPCQACAPQLLLRSGKFLGSLLVRFEDLVTIRTSSYILLRLGLSQNGLGQDP